MDPAASFDSMTQDLLLQIAGFLQPKDLLQLQCTSRETYVLDTNELWHLHCNQRWQPWPRYRMTTTRMVQLDSLMPNTTWQQRYLAMEKEAMKTVMNPEEFQQLDWYLSFVLSGIRGEGRSDHMPVKFTPSGVLLVPGHPPLPYELLNEKPPTTPCHIRSNLRGDQPFSDRQWLRISSFPPHFITKKKSNAEWLIVNENVMMVSCKKE